MTSEDLEEDVEDAGCQSENDVSGWSRGDSELSL